MDCYAFQIFCNGFYINWASSVTVFNFKSSSNGKIETTFENLPLYYYNLVFLLTAIRQL